VPPPAHLAIVLAIPAVAGVLSWGARRRPEAVRPIALALAGAIAVNELAWYVHVLRAGGLRFPHGLPLDLCDVVLWVTVYALARPSAPARDVAWFLGIAGSGMAVLTPDLEGPLPSYPAVKFFVSHGGIVAAALFLAWSRAHRPGPRSWWRVFLWTNAYAALVGAFNAAFGTNYMYLCEKPASATLLDWLGPWPWYVLAAEPVALALLALLYLPFRGAAVRPPSSPARPSRTVRPA
jgi:hypothetical integral membrane protein (TIGR02206 family)